MDLDPTSEKMRIRLRHFEKNADPTFEKKADLDPTSEKMRIRIRHFEKNADPYPTF